MKPRTLQRRKERRQQRTPQRPLLVPSLYIRKRCMRGTSTCFISSHRRRKGSQPTIYVSPARAPEHESSQFQPLDDQRLQVLTTAASLSASGDQQPTAALSNHSAMPPLTNDPPPSPKLPPLDRINLAAHCAYQADQTEIKKILNKRPMYHLTFGIYTANVGYISYITFACKPRSKPMRAASGSDRRGIGQGYPQGAPQPNVGPDSPVVSPHHSEQSLPSG